MARKILLADDSVTAQNMGRKILTDAGYEVVTVNNGSAALKKIAETKPDLVVLDVYMPGYSGLEVCQRIKENRETARIPILLTVGKLEPFKPEEARRARADAFVVKPFEASELLAALTKLEDKVIPQPEPYKPGRFAKAVASFERDTQAEKSEESDEGWKVRLRIPTGKPKERDSEPDIDYTSTQGKGVGEVVATPTPKAEPPKTFTENQFERPLPAGLPHDITPEEIAAITAAAAQLSGAAAFPAAQAEPEQKETRSGVTEGATQEVSESPAEDAAPVTFASAPEIAQPVEAAPAADLASMEEPAPGAVISELKVEPAEAIVEEPAPPVIEPAPVSEPSVAAAQVSDASTSSAPAEGTEPVAPWPDVAPAAPLSTETSAPSPEPAAATDDEVMAALQTLMPAASSESVPEATGQESEDHAPAGLVPASVGPARVAGPRWIAEEVFLAQEEAALSLEQEMEKAYAAVTTSAPLAATSAREAGEVREAGAAQAFQQPVVLASAAAAGEAAAGASRSSVQEEVAAQALQSTSSHAAPEIVVDKTEAPTVAGNEAQASTVVNEIENQIVGGIENMAANWKNIRDSIAGAAAKPAPAKEELHEAEPAKSEPEAASPSAPEKFASPVSDPKAIASIVDSVLAELRPKIVEEIARKLADSKKE